MDIENTINLTLRGMNLLNKGKNKIKILIIFNHKNIMNKNRMLNE